MQESWSNLTQEEREENKNLLPDIALSNAKKVLGEMAKVGEVIMDGNGTHFLVGK